MPHPAPTAPRAELTAADRLERLRDVQALAGLSSAALAAIAEIARPRFFRRGDEILAEGEPGRCLYVVLSGRVKMVRALENGRSLVLALFHPGELFGTVAALGAQTCDASMVAIDGTCCLAVDRDELFALFEERPRLVGEVVPALTRQLAECRNCIVELSCYRVETRFAQLLLKLSDNVGRREPEGVLIPIPLSRQELADMTGTTIETCIRVMSRWAKEEVVETRADGFLVRDRAALEASSAIRGC